MSVNLRKWKTSTLFPGRRTKRRAEQSQGGLRPARQAQSSWSEHQAREPELASRPTRPMCAGLWDAHKSHWFRVGEGSGAGVKDREQGRQPCSEALPSPDHPSGICCGYRGREGRVCSLLHLQRRHVQVLELGSCRQGNDRQALHFMRP